MISAEQFQRELDIIITNAIREDVVITSYSIHYTKLYDLLVGLKNYQKRYGSQVMLSDKKIDTEILYNKYDIFKKLHYYYLFAGIFMLVFTILQLFYVITSYSIHYTKLYDAIDISFSRMDFFIKRSFSEYFF